MTMGLLCFMAGRLLRLVLLSLPFFDSGLLSKGCVVAAPNHDVIFRFTVGGLTRGKLRLSVQTINETGRLFGSEPDSIRPMFATREGRIYR
jgi:hypothetical protein